MPKHLLKTLFALLIAILGIAALSGSLILTDAVEAASPDYVPGGGDEEPEEPEEPGDISSTPALGAPCYAHEYQQEVWIETCNDCVRWDGTRGLEDWRLRCYISDSGYYWHYAPGTFVYCSSRRSC